MAMGLRKVHSENLIGEMNGNHPGSRIGEDFDEIF
jgi:hypothetical protein